MIYYRRLLGRRFVNSPASTPAETSASPRPSRTEQLVGAGILLLLALIVVAYAVQVVTNRDYFLQPGESAYRAGGVHPFPDIEAAGWAAASGIGRFAAGDLYLKIDGRADAYISQGVVGLTFGTYRHEAEAGRQIDVYRYDLDSPEHARALYESERPPGIAEEPIGRAGYRAGGSVFFWAGTCYAQVLPTSLDDRDATAAFDIATALAEQIEKASRPHGQ